VRSKNTTDLGRNKWKSRIRINCSPSNEGSIIMIAEEIGYLTIRHISKYLSIKTKTLYALVGCGKIPHYRVGRLIRFKKEEIDTWMEENKADKKDNANIPAEAHRGGRQRKGPTRGIDRIIKTTIDQVKEKEYTPCYGKSDRIKGLGKEVDHGVI